MIITSKTPKLDLHNEIGSMVKVLVDDFIRYNYLLKNEVVIIIHGISGNVVKHELYEALKQNKYVKDYKTDNWNIGQTIVEIKKS